MKLYCEAVGLEPKPLVDEFMAIVNGEREIAIKERPVAETQEAETPPPPAPTPAPASEEPDLFRQDPVPPPPAPTPAPAETEQPAFSRFAAPMREYSTTPSAFPLNPRIIVLAVAGLALLAGLVFGIRALYCATSSSGDTTEEAPAPEPAAAVEASPRTPQDIPSLYID